MRFVSPDSDGGTSRAGWRLEASHLDSTRLSYDTTSILDGEAVLVSAAGALATAVSDETKKAVLAEDAVTAARSTTGCSEAAGATIVVVARPEEKAVARGPEERPWCCRC